MISGSTLVHAICGAPRVDACGSILGAACWHCGAHSSRAMLVRDWMGASFVGQNRVRAQHGQHICEACVWVMARSSPILGRMAKPGKQPPNWRNFSVLVEGDELVTATKAEKPIILAFLRRAHREPWLAAIAESGQKHVIPYAPINMPGSCGRVQLDEQTIAVPGGGGWQLVDTAAALLTAGATKDEIARGDYAAPTWIRCETAIREFESQFGRQRSSAWFGLALWLSQRDAVAVIERLERERGGRA